MLQTCLQVEMLILSEVSKINLTDDLMFHTKNITLINNQVLIFKIATMWAIL